MYVEHRRDRHVDVARRHQLGILAAANRYRAGQGMQDQLAMREVDPLGVAGGAGRIEGGRHRVFIEIGKLVRRLCGRQQALILADAVRQLALLVISISDQQCLVDRGQLPGNGVVERRELAVDEDDAILGMIHRVKNLLG